jgi:hypothetical protein
LTGVIAGDTIRIRGSTSNDGDYLVTTAIANTITLDATTPPLANETSTVYITIAKKSLKSNNVVVDLNTSRPDKPPITWLQYGSYLNAPAGAPDKIGAASDGKLRWTATLISIHAANNDIWIPSASKGTVTVRIKAGAGEVLKYWPGYSYQFGFAGTINKLPGMGCTSVAINGIDLDIVLNTGNQTCTPEGSNAVPVNGAISLACNGIFPFASACRIAGVGGYSDWRVCNFSEFANLFNFSVGHPNATAFPSIVNPGYIWTSTTDPDGFAIYWWRNSGTGSQQFLGVAKTTTEFVMLVRGGV